MADQGHSRSAEVVEEETGEKPEEPTGPSPNPGDSNLPPAGIFPATIYYSEDGEKVVLEFQMEWEPGSLYGFEVRVDPQSDRGRRFLAAAKRCAGVSRTEDDSALDGKRVSISGEQRYVGGKLTWAFRRLVKLRAPQPRGGVEPGVEPDGYDALAERMLSKLTSEGSVFAQDGDNMVILLPHNRRIPIDPTSRDYAALQHGYTGVGTAEYRGRVLTQRVLFKAMVRARADKVRDVRFSFADEQQVLVPVAGGKVLRITAAGFSLVENGTDGVWLEHPRGSPLPWDAELDPREGLGKFEEWLVDTQAIPAEPLRFLLAVALGVFPFIRQRTGARPILELIGRSGQGKTTGAERFLRLYQLGEVQGDYSLAQVKRDRDMGLIIRDNVETTNLTRFMEDFFIFGATGGEWARVGTGRNSDHPVIAVTTVEGIARRSEMNRRLIRFEFAREPRPWSEGSIRAQIDVHRAVIFRGIAELVRSTLAQNPIPVPPSIPMPDFTDYCVLIYRPLRAWEEVAGKPADFADTIFEAWLSQQSSEEAVDSAGPYPRLLERVLAGRAVQFCPPYLSAIQENSGYSWGEYIGHLFVATPTTWLTALKETAARERDLVLPARPEGLRNRLRELKPEEEPSRGQPSQRSSLVVSRGYL